MSFVAPAFLAGLAFLALPWLLHRFADEAPEVRPFPTDRFLEAVPPPVSRTRRLRHRALLALRLLALAALCLLFAGPLLDRFGPSANAERLHLYALDTSWSMRAPGRFERALDALRSRLRALPADAAAGVVAFADRTVTLTPADGTASDALGALDGLARTGPGYGRADYGEVMRRLDGLAATAPLPVEAVVFTDVQASGLPARSAELLAPRLTSLEVVRVDGSADEPAAGPPDGPSDGRRPVPNARLDAEATSVDGVGARIVVRVTGSGGMPAGTDPVRRRITVSSGGEVLADLDVAVPSGATLERTLDVPALPPVEDPALDIAFEVPDALPDDDAVRVPVREVRPVEVALGTAAGSDGSSGRGDVSEAAATFLGTALETDGRARVEPLVERSGAATVPAGVAHAVLFVPVDDAAAMAGAVRTVERGIDVLAVLLPAVAPPGTATGGGAGAGGALGREGTDAGTGEGEGVGRVDEAHPLALGDIDWYDVRFYSPTPFAPADGDAVLMETERGAPLLVERPVGGNARLLLLADPLDGEASDLPFAPAFVDLVGATLDWFGASGALPASVRVGESVPLPANVQVLDPDGDALLALGDAAAASTFVPERPGLYRVVDGRGERSLVVLIDARESDLAPMDGAAVSGWSRGTRGSGPGADGGDRSDANAADAATDTATPTASVRADDPSPDADASAAIADTSRGASSVAADAPARLWHLYVLLPLAALLLFGETLLANRRLDVRRDGS